METNKRAVNPSVDKTAVLAGGMGAYGAKQTPEAALRRSVLANLLGENIAYEDGQLAIDRIQLLVPQVDPVATYKIAMDAKFNQKLRHVPLLIAREMVRHDSHRWLVGDLLKAIITRPDDITEFMAMYWKDGKTPIAAQVKKGLAAAFNKFDAYQLAKWSETEKEITLRDVLFMVHARPANEELFTAFVDGTLPTPDTWENALSTGKDKKESWERLIKNRKLGAKAFLMNLRNMRDVGVDASVLNFGFDTINSQWLLPLDYLRAYNAVPSLGTQIEKLMFKSFANGKLLKGNTVLVLDASGSMGAEVSSKSKFSRFNAGLAMLMLGVEMSENPIVYLTAGSDYARKHNTVRMSEHLRGFALTEEGSRIAMRLGGGGIFTKQSIEYIRGDLGDMANQIDRIIVISDSQDIDGPYAIPQPFGRVGNYIVDVSSHSHGVNYATSKWSAEVVGWSEYFLHYIAALEGAQISGDSE